MKKNNTTTTAPEGQDKTYYLIAHNIEDHLGYNNEPVYIVKKLRDDYFIVSNDAGTQWQCGEEELQVIKDKGNGHTPGEWEWEQSRGNNRYEHHVFSRNGGKYGSYVIAQLGMEDTGEKEPEEIRANARLIASAPQLKAENEKLKENNRELLKTIYHEIDSHCISETENVSMTTIRRILVKHGATEAELY